MTTRMHSALGRLLISSDSGICRFRDNDRMLYFLCHGANASIGAVFYLGSLVSCRHFFFV